MSYIEVNGIWGQVTLKPAWAQTTVQWMVDELYAPDVRWNGEDKMPPMPFVYLHPEARVRFPALPLEQLLDFSELASGSIAHPGIKLFGRLRLLCRRFAIRPRFHSRIVHGA